MFLYPYLGPVLSSPFKPQCWHQTEHHPCTFLLVESTLVKISRWLSNQQWCRQFEAYNLYPLTNYPFSLKSRQLIAQSSSFFSQLLALNENPVKNATIFPIAFGLCICSCKYQPVYNKNVSHFVSAGWCIGVCVKSWVWWTSCSCKAWHQHAYATSHWDCQVTDYFSEFYVMPSSKKHHILFAF